MLLRRQCPQPLGEERRAGSKVNLPGGRRLARQRGAFRQDVRGRKAAPEEPPASGAVSGASGERAISCRFVPTTSLSARPPPQMGTALSSQQQGSAWDVAGENGPSPVQDS